MCWSLSVFDDNSKVFRQPLIVRLVMRFSQNLPRVLCTSPLNITPVAREARLGVLGGALFEKVGVLDPIQDLA